MKEKNNLMRLADFTRAFWKPFPNTDQPKKRLRPSRVTPYQRINLLPPRLRLIQSSHCLPTVRDNKHAMPVIFIISKYPTEALRYIIISGQVVPEKQTKGGKQICFSRYIRYIVLIGQNGIQKTKSQNLTGYVS